MKRLSCIILFLTAAALGAAGPDDKVVQVELKKLAGDWECTGGELKEEKLPEAGYKGMTMTIKDDTFKIQFQGKVIDEGTVKVDPTKSPKVIDLFSTKEKQRRLIGIYKLDGDKLLVCYDAGNEPPKEFATKKDSFLTLMTYQRKK
jgi:uncharacterized protein (TIGR03067 family)